jgi:hypothetical protein
MIVVSALLPGSSRLVTTVSICLFVIHFWREAEVSPISGKYGGGKK